MKKITFALIFLFSQLAFGAEVLIDCLGIVKVCSVQESKTKCDAPVNESVVLRLNGDRLTSETPFVYFAEPCSISGDALTCSARVNSKDLGGALTENGSRQLVLNTANGELKWRYLSVLTPADIMYKKGYRGWSNTYDAICVPRVQDGLPKRPNMPKKGVI